MKRIVFASLAGMFVLAVAWPASAQPGGRERPHRRERVEQVERERPAHPHARAQAQSADEPPVPPARMSREERRQLRRDIHEAGRDLYPPHRERPPQP